MGLLLRLLAALGVVLTLLAPATAREEIRAFAADITLRTDGSVRVIETIDVQAEQVEIRRGIYRDIPVTLRADDGSKIRVGFEVESVTRDGAPEQFRTERMGDFRRIWIGNPDVFISVGVHRYVITYTMDRMARSFADRDELYWNVTGNYWIFPIETAVARVTLPESGRITDLSAYTGLVGSSESAVRITRVSDTEAIFRTTRALGAGEGLTVSVSLAKGVIAYPQGLEAVGDWLSDLRDTFLPVFAVLIVLGYNLIAWMKVGRDPPKGTIIPLFHPPKDFSPALTHYVHRWGFDNSGWTAMTAAIFNLGVKGLVTIDTEEDSLRVIATGKQPEQPLPVGEKILFAYFSSRRLVRINKANGVDLGKKRTEFVNAISSENRQVWFRNNFGYAAMSFVLSAALLVLMVVFDVIDIEWLIGAAFVGIFGGVIGTAVMGAVRKGGLGMFMVLGWGALLLFNVGGGLLDTFTGLSINTAAIAAASLVVISIAFAVLMRAPTIQGRKVMDQIDGFKLYLETAEKNRLNMTDEPPMSVERFERILPYAMALGVEKPWSEHFEGELARNALSDTPPDGYHPNWYRSRSGFSPGTMAQTMSAASAGMAAAMVAAQPVQASSSGSSSGGFSGGGGGGGGGGGW